jgi:hypothetical protein
MKLISIMIIAVLALVLTAGGVSAAKSITINFAGTGTGAVLLTDITTPANTRTCTGTCTISLGNNDVGTLAVTAYSGLTFGGWSGQTSGITGCSGTTCNFSMGNNAQSVTATFNPNLVPTTSSISPSSKTLNAAQFTMNVTGTNFVSSSIVRFNGSNRATNYLNATALSVTIPATDMTIAGTFSITVFNPTPGGGTSGAQTFTVTAMSMYSLNITYNFTETNPNSTWQSISIHDSSYGDALTNVSILNATSGRWESILTSAFTGGNSTAEHVNVTKGASGNASSYDAGGGQIKIRYNWTNSLFNNNLGVDMINVTVLYINSIFLLNITTNTTNVPEANRSELQLKYNISEDNFTVQIKNTSSGWENAAILNATGLPYRNITLNSSWLIPDGTFPGNVASINRSYVNVRYLGVNQSVNGTLYLDYQRVYSS